MRRNWIKLYVDQCLRGTMMDELDNTERWVWIGFLLLAGDNAYDGKICLTENMGYTDEQIAALLKVDLELLKRAKRKMIKFEKIKVLENNVIKIINWGKYQSDYQRQKPHRDPEFIKLREYIKERDDYTCQNCQKHESELDVPLCIHHIDNDPSNNSEDNLITLCMSCHSQLYKKAVHPQKEKERKIQEKKFKSKVQVKSSSQKFNLDRDKDKEIDIDNNIKEKCSRKHLELAAFLEQKIKEKLPRHRFQGKKYKENWANTFRIMVEKKEASEDEIKRLISWIFDESDFWFKNILSADKLRKQFGRLWAESGLQREEEEKKKYQEWISK